MGFLRDLLQARDDLIQQLRRNLDDAQREVHERERQIQERDVMERKTIQGLKLRVDVLAEQSEQQAERMDDYLERMEKVQQENARLKLEIADYREIIGLHISKGWQKDVLEILNKYFSLEELRTLCFKLDIKYGDLPGETHQAKARELIIRMNYLRRTHDLINECKRMRPDIPDEWWPIV